MKRSKKMFTVMLALCVALSMAMASVTANAATKKRRRFTSRPLLLQWISRVK